MRDDAMNEHDAPEVLDLDDKLASFDALWTPHRIARFDGHQLLLAKVEGEFVWHDHADHDEVFIPLTGVLTMDLEGGPSRRIGPGQVLVVPAGVRHRPRADEGPVSMLVIDPMGVKHTGDEVCERTVEDYPEI